MTKGMTWSDTRSSSEQSPFKLVSLGASSLNEAAGAGDTASKAKIRVAIITQQNAPHLGIYLSAVATCTAVSNVAVTDVSGTTFAAASQAWSSTYPNFRTYRRPSEMIERFHPDLVLVSLAANEEPRWIREALAAGCHVLAEKPACVQREDFAALVELTNEKNRNLMLALPNRVAPETLRAKEIIDAGWLGKPYGVTFFQTKDQARLTRPAYQESWHAKRDQSGGGHLIWEGIHDLDRVFFITGDRVEKVTGFHNNVGGQPVQIEDAEAVAFRFKSGMVGTFHGGYFVEDGSMRLSMSLWGSNGWMEISGYRGPDGSRRSFQWYSTHPQAPRGVQAEDGLPRANLYQMLVQAAVDSARGSRQAPLTGEDCLHVLSIIFGAYRASDTGVAQTIR